MGSRKKLILLIVVMILIVVAGLVYSHHINIGPFQGNSVAGLPDGHVRVLEAQQPEFLQLQFSQHGGVEFNHYGSGVFVNFAFYEGDVRTIDETIAGIQTMGQGDFNGHMTWGLTTQGNEKQELIVNFRAAGIVRNYFDFSQLDFPIRLIAGPMLGLGNVPIIQDYPYVLQVWQAGATTLVSGNVFDSANLRRNHYTAILYITFE